MDKDEENYIDQGHIGCLKDIFFFPQQDGRRLQKNHLWLYDVDELLQNMVATGFMLLPISQDVNYLIYLCTFRN